MTTLKIPARIFIQTITSKGLQFYRRHEAYGPAAFFFAGFAFDVLTLGRIDDPIVISQQVCYLLIIAGFLYAEMRHAIFPLSLMGWMAKLWSYREFIIHFILGSLLSVYTLYFFKSSSLVSSFSFLLLMALVLIANEFERFQKGGLGIRLALWSLCLISFTATIIPVALGFVGLLPFVLSLALSVGLIFGFQKICRNRLAKLTKIEGQSSGASNERSWRWAYAVQAVFFALYLFNLIPPVPLSIESIGIYHDVKKEKAHYVLSWYDNSWKFWEKGAQTFLARPGDRVFVFTRIFSPARFKDRVFVRWVFDDPNQGWTSSDAIPLEISGGRDEGFRGFAYKQNFQPGDWRVEIETMDGREIGRISFSVIADQSSEPRSSQNLRTTIQ